MTENDLIEIDMYSVIKQKYIERDVLDKIISEATSKKISYTDHDKDTYRRGVNDVMKIINKYKAKSEG